MLVVGLTGGIGSGKTTVANHFAALGVPIIDADILARALVAPGQPAVQEIKLSLGPQFIDSSGNLDRVAMRNLIYQQPQQRRVLESILHPKIRRLMLERLHNLTGHPYAILVIPLLIEANQTDLCQRILVVDIPESVQLARIKLRDGYSATEIHNIMHSQCHRFERLNRADDILDNSSPHSTLGPQIKALHTKYLTLAEYSTP